MERFIAELDISVPVYMPKGERKPLSNAEYYECLRGYWNVHFETDKFETPRPTGLRLTTEMEAPNREAAEDAALTGGLRFAQVVAVYSGSPLASPRLNRLGRIGVSEGLFEQYNYYFLDGLEALPHVLLRPYNLEKLLAWFGDLDETKTRRLELAARWYGIALSAQDPLDGYLSVWIGLESVGPVFSDSVHVSGLKAHCEICKNPSGSERDKGKAGIEHAIKEVAPEILCGRSLADLKSIRDDIAHGLKPAQTVRLEAQLLLPNLQLALIFAILTASRPDTSAPGSGKAILPREFKPYPFARAMVRSVKELTFHKPFYGGWLDIERCFSKESSRIEASGRYIPGARTSIKVNSKTVIGTPEFEIDYVIFQRHGREWDDKESDQSIPLIPVIPWREIPVSDAWKRYYEAQDSD